MTGKITTSLTDEHAAAARAAVDSGRAESVAGYIAQGAEADSLLGLE